MSVLEQPRPASSSSYFTAVRPRGCRLLLRVHSAENLRHVSSHGTYCKIYVGSTEMVRGSRHYRQSHGNHKKLSASASAHSLGNILASSFDSGRSHRGDGPPSSTADTMDADADADEDGLAPRMRVLKTQVQKGKRPNPVWNEKFDIPVADPSHDILSIRVKSARLMSSPSIGACAISLKFVPGTTVDRWINLLDGRKDAGRIRLQLRIVDDHGPVPSAGGADGRRIKDPAQATPSVPGDGPNQADSWLSLPDEAGPGAVVAIPPLTPHKPRRSTNSHRAKATINQDDRDEDDVLVRENGGSSTSNESEPTSEGPRSPAALLVVPMPGSQSSRASSRRYRESRRRRESRKLGSPMLLPVTPTRESAGRRRRASVEDAAARDEDDDQEEDDDDEETARRTEKNLSGLDYGRSSAPTADSAPATARVSFNSFVHPSSTTLTVVKPMSEPKVTAPESTTPDATSKTTEQPSAEPKPPLEQSFLADRGTMTLDELEKSRLQMASARRPTRRTAPRESSRLHFDSDEEDEEEDQDVQVIYSAPRGSPRRSSVQMFEDDEEVVQAHQEKLRLTGSVSARGSDRTNLSGLSLDSLTPSVVAVSESLGDAMDVDYDEEDEDSDEEEGDSDEEMDVEEPRIPLNASLTKLLCRFSANVLIEEEELEDEDDEDAFGRPGSEEFVPILDFAEHAPVDDIDCA